VLFRFFQKFPKIRFSKIKNSETFGKFEKVLTFLKLENKNILYM